MYAFAGYLSIKCETDEELMKEISKEKNNNRI